MSDLQEQDKASTEKTQLRRRHRGLRYTLYGLSAVVCLLLVSGGIEYYRLQPKHHFSHAPVLSQPTKTQAGTSVATTKTASSTSVPAVPADTFNVLLLGSDERTGGNTAGHSDSIIIVHVDLAKNQYAILSIPRDTRTYVKGVGYTKLTSVMYLEQSAYGSKAGTQAAIEAISNLTGLTINYYAETNYWGLQDIVDAVGGIDMNIPFPVTLTHAWYPQDQGKKFASGTYQLDGRMVTEVVHERYSLSNGDYGRQQLQEEALIGIAKKVLHSPELAPKVIHAIPKFLIATNMNTQDMLSLALSVNNFHANQVHYYQVPGQGKVMYNDALKANDDEIILNTTALKQIVLQHFE